MEPASEARTTIDWVHRILKDERDIVISSRPLQATAFQVENIRIAYVFYEDGLSINVMYTVGDPKKRAVGFKLSEGMEVPADSRPASSLPDRDRSWPEPFAVPTSLSRPITNPAGRAIKPQPGRGGRHIITSVYGECVRETAARWRFSVVAVACPPGERRGLGWQSQVKRHLGSKLAREAPTVQLRPSTPSRQAVSSRSGSTLTPIGLTSNSGAVRIHSDDADQSPKLSACSSTLLPSGST